MDNKAVNSLTQGVKSVRLDNGWEVLEVNKGNKSSVIIMSSYKPILHALGTLKDLSKLIPLAQSNLNYKG